MPFDNSKPFLTTVDREADITDVFASDPELCGVFHDPNEEGAKVTALYQMDFTQTGYDDSRGEVFGNFGGAHMIGIKADVGGVIQYFDRDWLLKVLGSAQVWALEVNEMETCETEAA